MSELQPLIRVQRREVVKADSLHHFVRIFAVDRLDSQQREVPLVLFRRSDLSGDGRSRLQAEAADLARRDVDVVRAGEVVVIGTAEESEAVGQNFERPFAEHQPVELGPLLEDLEDQVLLLQPGVFGQPFFLGQPQQLLDRHSLQVGNVDVALLDFLITLIGGKLVSVLFRVEIAFHEANLVGESFRLSLRFSHDGLGTFCPQK